MSDREWPTDDTTDAERAAEAAYWRSEAARDAAADAAAEDAEARWAAEEDGEGGDEPPDPWSANDGW